MQNNVKFKREGGNLIMIPEAIVSKAGVVNISTIYNRDITVNSESMIDMLDDAIRQLTSKPLCDINGHFAGKVTITVEFLGDMAEKDGLEDAEGA